MDSTSLRRVAALAATAALAFPLSACGGDSISVPDGKGGSVKVDRSGEDFSIDTEDGSAVGSAGKLPDGFPTDDIPLVAGAVISGIGVNDGDQVGWNVVISPTSSEAANGAFALMTESGFTQTSTMDANGTTIKSYSSDKWEVLVSVIDVEGDLTVTYAAAPASS